MTAADSANRAMRAQALNGSPRQRATSRKYTVSTTSITIILPVWQQNGANRRPTYLKFAIPPESDAVYCSFDRLAAAAIIPTISADGDEQIFHGTEIARHDSDVDRISLVAEASTTITISYIWT